MTYLPSGMPLPQPLPDDVLRANIAERFAGAYEAQLGLLKRQAEQEQRSLQADVSSLRQFAYSAQHHAAQHRSQVEAARQSLGVGTAGSLVLREALGMVRSEIAAE
ncbi:unnamed protein product, partial [Polarella glacialis]